MLTALQIFLPFKLSAQEATPAQLQAPTCTQCNLIGADVHDNAYAACVLLQKPHRARRSWILLHGCVGVPRAFRLSRWCRERIVVNFVDDCASSCIHIAHSLPPC